MKIKSLIKLNLMRAAMTLALVLTCATAWAQTTQSVTYIDADGNTQTVTATVLTGSESDLSAGWYVVNSDITYTSKVTLYGDMNLILVDGKTMSIGTADSPISGANAIDGSDYYTLTIYGQSGQTGKLCAYNNSSSYDAVVLKHFNQHGGIVIINSNTDALSVYGNLQLTQGSLNVISSGASKNAIYISNTLSISGGTLIANAGYGIVGAVNFTGGNLTAIGTYRGISGNTNLSWTSTTNTFKCSRYGGNVTIAEGKTFYDGATPYSGTLNSSQKDAIAGKTLRPYSSNDFSVNDEGTEYTIYSAIGWDMFCDMLDNFDHSTSGGYCFDGKTVKLGADISITRAAGNTGYHDFTGIFDGQGHTLTVNITDTQNQGTAPFRVISNGATIRNLHVTGSVTGTTHAAGLVGKACAGTMLIENCLVETNVNSTVGSNRHCGGIVGHGFGNNLNPNSVNLTLRNCVYAGTITCDNNYIGGLQGWSDGNTLTLENCLFAGNYQGTATGTAAFHPIALHNTGKTTNLTATNVFTAVAPTVTNANFIAANGTKTTGRTTAPAGLGNQVATYNHMNTTIYEHGLLYDGLYYVAPTLSTDNSGAYLINNEDDWTNFCDALYNNGTWNRFSGQTVKLGADISVSRMAGYDNHDFLGTFDGNHKTLTFTATATASYLAPFRNVLGNSDTDHAVIHDLNVVTNITSADQRHAAGLIAEVWGYVDVVNCNVTVDITANKGTTNTDLYPAGIASQVVSGAQITVSGCTVGGTISTDGKYAGGIIGIVQGSASITNSLSSVTINSSTEGDGTHGGLVGVQGTYNGSTLNIEGCVFNGSLLGASTNSCGGFVGWRGKTINITNSLFAPTQVSINTTEGSTPCATFVRNGDSNTTITNCYYTDTLGTAQGTKVYSISKGQYVTTLEINGTATQSYTVSGLSFYSTGIKYGDMLYAAASDEVSLTLGNTVPEGYFLGYSASPTEATLSGSGNPYTLTMPDADVVITANTNFPPVSYVDENGETQQCTDYIWLTGTETTLGAAGQETWCVVHSTLDYSQGIQLLGNTHIILCDGAAMNIGSSESPVSGSSFQEKVGFYGDGNNLSLYAQSGNTGALTIYSQSCSFFVKDLTIAGGNVNATSLSDVPVIFCDNLTVRRSSLEVYANYYAAIQANNDVNLSNVTANLNSPNGTGLVCSNFAVDHSQLTVNARYQAIQASNVITLGCTAATDFIKATCTSSLTDSYYGTVKIADGQTLYAGTNDYTGTLTDAQRQAIGGQKLTNVPPTYDYIDLEGTGATHTAVVIDADNMPTSLSGWYIVQGTVNYTNTINLGGDTHIILADNAVMNVTVTGNNYGIRSTSGNNYSFFVYGQTGQSGELNVTSNDFACYIYGGDITIAGGKVTASGLTGIFAQYNNNGGNVTIQNATVTATASFAAIYSNNGDITIDNSNVTATATVNNGIAIFAENGDIIFRNGGKTTASNSNYIAIYANEGDITITDCEVEAIGSTGIWAYSGNNSSDVGNVTIQNATVTASGSSSSFGIYTENGSVTINGGQVSAIGNIYGIYAQNSNDNITLGWTNPTDYIYVNKYYAGGTLSIADNTTFITEDGIAFESGTVNASDINGKTLYPYIEGSVPYIDENGQRQLCTDYTIISDNTVTTFGQNDNVERWYVVTGTVNFTSPISFMSNSNIIIAEGAVLNVGTAENPVSGYLGGIFSHFDLKIYAESGTTGHVSVYSASNRNAIFGDAGELVIVNCEVNASGSVGIINNLTGINIVGCQLNLAGENGVKSATGPVTLKNTTLTAPSLTERVIYSPVDLTLDSCTVVAATSATNVHAIESYGGTNGIIIKNNSNINVETTTDLLSNGIFSQMGVSIEGSTVKAKGNRGIVAGGALTITDATVKATGKSSAIWAGSSITLDGGQVTAESTSSSAICAYNGNITIRNNGKTIAESTNNYGCFAISAENGNVIIESGTVEATGIMGIYGKNVNISGGQVSATGPWYGVLAWSGNITLGWTNASDYIYANSYYADGGTLSIADGKAFKDVDGNNYESGPVNASDINGKWLYPSVASIYTKGIEAHGTDESPSGWYLIASPLAGETNAEAVAHLINTTNPENFDLYRFDPSNEGSEWVNYKTDSFNLVNGHGYLYARKNTKTLVFTGPFITDTDSVAVDLEYDAADDHKCWNLVGNPFPCEATINKPYYMLNADGATINPEAIVGGTIPPCTAVFVKGESGDDRVVFSKVSAPASSAPIGAIDGLFSVSADKQVYFSQGNLQYQPSTTTWRFASNQYDLLVKPEDTISFHPVAGYYADVTSQYTEDYTGWIDLFGWGTSGWNSGAIAYMPYSTSYTAEDFYPGGDLNNDLTGTCANADWAWYNPISNGGNAANQWRTLTHDEWAYLFSGRDGATSKYGHGSVNGVNGMIILPDNWTLPDSCSFTPGNSDWTNSYTTTEWAAMEAAGAVFLPAAGQRSFGTFVNNVGNLGRYWSSTHRNNTAAYDVWFHSDFISELDTQVYYSNRSMGYSVRPVQDAQ